MALHTICSHCCTTVRKHIKELDKAALMFSSSGLDLAWTESLSVCVSTRSNCNAIEKSRTILLFFPLRIRN